MKTAELGHSSRSTLAVGKAAGAGRHEWLGLRHNIAAPDDVKGRDAGWKESSIKMTRFIYVKISEAETSLQKEGAQPAKRTQDVIEQLSGTARRRPGSSTKNSLYSFRAPLEDGPFSLHLEVVSGIAGTKRSVLKAISVTPGSPSLGDAW